MFARRRHFAVLLAVALIGGVMAIAAPGGAVTPSATLFAGQNTPVGNVTVTNDGTSLYITYQLDPGWCMTESHLAVAPSVAGIPQTKTGNPVPGRFPYGEYYDPCASGDTLIVPLPAGPSVVIAAHAKVWDGSSLTTQSIYSDAGITAYGPMDHYAGLSDPWTPAGLAVRTWVHPSWPTTITGAYWISTAYYVEAPYDANSWRRFSGSFSVPGLPVSGSAALATADNAEEFYVNGIMVGSDGEVQGPFVDNYEWNTVLSYPFMPVMGSNGFDFIVRNYAGSNSPTLNPTGLLYRLDYSYLARSETAWAGTTAFPGANWAKHFTYAPVSLHWMETVQVPGNGTHAVSSTVLSSGQPYTLKASGTYRFANWGEFGIADAHCNYRSAAYGGPGWVHSTIGYLEVWVNGAMFDWGPDNCPTLTPTLTNHNYEGSITGSGAALDFFIPDSCTGETLGCYDDNSGVITVEIWGYY